MTAKAIDRRCHCGVVFKARVADVKRGWAKCCSKSCAARLREQKTGNYRRYCERRDRAEAQSNDGEFFNDAHLFSNEE